MDPTWDVTNYGPSRAARGTQPPAKPGTEPEDDIARVIEDVRAERVRQVSGEGWSREHDDEHRDGELAQAAAVYAVLGGTAGDIRAALIREVVESLAQRRFPGLMLAASVRALWPFSWHWFRPRNPRHDLVRAAALLVAEIERLDRAVRRPVVASVPPSTATIDRDELARLRGE